MKPASIFQLLAICACCATSIASQAFGSTAASSSLLSLHKSLIEIESITPNEHKVGTFLVDYLISHNLTVSTQAVGNPTLSSSGRFNIHAYIGSSAQTRTLVSSHIDTVPPFWPYELRDDNEIWGRGSVDAKASVSAQVTAFLELQAAGELQEGDAALLFVVGEETDGLGMRTANDLNMSWESVIFGEPTEGKLACGHKGIQGFRVQAHGKAAHSGYPWLGVSANSLLIAALSKLEGLKFPSSDKYGETTLNIGRMEGGVAANVVAEAAEAQCALRLAAGTPDEARKIVQEAVKSVAKDGELEVVFLGEGYAPVDIDCNIKSFDTITVNYGTDIPNLKGNHKRYLYGPGSILVAHSDHEHLSVGELERAVKDYKKIILSTLKDFIPIEL